MNSVADADARTFNLKAIGKPALLAAFAAARLGSVVSVVAPAGYGKTTLFDSWQKRADLRTVRVRIGPEHNDDASLRDHLVDALGGLVPSNPDLVDEWRAGAGKWDRALLRALSETYLILMIEDVHHLTDPGSLALVKRLVQHTPKGMVLGLSGRGHVYVGLSRARMERRLLTVTCDDLLLTRADLGALRRQQLTDAQIDDVFSNSGGWPMALPWAVAQATGAPEAPRERLALDRFLAEEVWQGLEPSFIDHLNDAAALSPVTFDTLDAARQSVDSTLLGVRLSEAPLPLVTVSACNTITVHPLLRPSLRARRSGSAAAESQLLRRAAEHLSRTDRDAEAFRILLATRDRPALIDFMYSAGRRAALQGKVDMVRGWLDEFSPEERFREVRLQSVAMGIDAAEGNLAAAVTWVRRLRTMGVPEDEHARELSGVLSGLLGADVLAGDSVGGTGWWGVVAQLNDALATMNAGRLDQAEAQLASLAPFCADAPMIDVWRLHTIAYLQARLDRDDEARATVVAASALLVKAGLRGHPMAIVLDALLALLAACAGDRRLAIEQLDLAHRRLPALVSAVPARALLPTVILAEAACVLGLEPRAAKVLDTLPGDLLPGNPDDFLRTEYERLSDSVRAVRGRDEVQVTAVQQRVLRALGSHKTVPAIAREMGRSPATIRSHIRALFGVLGVHSRAEAVERARSLRLLDDHTGQPTPSE